MAMRDEIQSGSRFLRVPLAVPTPEWPGQNGRIYVRKLSAREMDGWYSRADDDNGRAQFVAMAACDEAGNRIFNDADAVWLGDEDFSVIDRIFNAAMMHNRSTPAAKAELQKNS